MIKKLNSFEKMLLLSMTFTITLVIIRFLRTNDVVYFFYPWNLFLATIPLLFSRHLKKHKYFNIRVIFMLAGWLLFLPNAPYLITDIFHFSERPPLPYWFDLLIVVTGAWNGLVSAIVSLLQVEDFLSLHIQKKWRSPVTVALIGLCSYGMFLGRYDRYNSWDIVTKPGDLAHTLISHITEPREHAQTWLFTISFAVMLSIIYFTMKKMQVITRAE